MEFETDNDPKASKYFVENAVGQGLAKEVAEKMLLEILGTPLPEALTVDDLVLLVGSSAYSSDLSF